MNVSVDWLADPPEDDVEQEPKRFYGVVTATVINPLDPMTLGRMQVELHFLDDLALSAWARVAVPMAGQFSGFYHLPKPGDEVLVAFEHGDVNSPYIIGSLWNATSPPPLPSPLPQIRAIRSPLGNQLVFTEAPPTVTIQNAPTPPETIPAPPTPGGAYQTLSLTPAGIIADTSMMNVIAATGVQIMVGANVITVNQSGVTIASSGVLNLTSGEAMNIVSAGTLTIKGAMVVINP